MILRQFPCMMPCRINTKNFSFHRMLIMMDLIRNKILREFKRESGYESVVDEIKKLWRELMEYSRMKILKCSNRTLAIGIDIVCVMGSVCKWYEHMESNCNKLYDQTTLYYQYQGI